MWLGASERVLLILRESRVDFLRQRASVESDVLDLVVGSSRNWRWRYVNNGRGFDLSGSVIVREM